MKGTTDDYHITSFQAGLILKRIHKHKIISKVNGDQTINITLLYKRPTSGRKHRELTKESKMVLQELRYQPEHDQKRKTGTSEREKERERELTELTGQASK